MAQLWGRAVRQRPAAWIGAKNLDGRQTCLRPSARQREVSYDLPPPRCQRRRSKPTSLTCMPAIGSSDARAQCFCVARRICKPEYRDVAYCAGWVGCGALASKGIRRHSITCCDAGRHARIESGLQPVETHHSRHCFGKTPMQTSAACLMSRTRDDVASTPGANNPLSDSNRAVPTVCQVSLRFP